jgi:hypothetical protein
VKPLEAYVLAGCVSAGASDRSGRSVGKPGPHHQHPSMFWTGVSRGQFRPSSAKFHQGQRQTWTSDLNWFGLALVHHRLGHPDDARQCLDKGIQWLEREGPPSPELPAKLLPQDWLEAQLLRREAEETLEVKRSP